MKKSELKNGALIQLRNGDICLKINGYLIDLENGGYISLKNYDSDFNYKLSDKQFDIMKIYNDISGTGGDGYYLYKTKRDIIWTWERKEESKSVEILTPEERKILKHFIEPLGEKVNKITAWNNICFIEDINGCSLIEFSYTKIGLEFKNMEKFKDYTLKELGL